MKRSAFAALLAALTLSACIVDISQPTRAPVVDGNVRIIDRFPGAHPNPAADQWWTQRRLDDGQLALVDLRGTPAVRADVPGGGLMGRRVQASLAATPFLRWSWFLEPTAFGGGPGTGQERGLRLMIHFKSAERPWMEELSSWIWAAPAEWDRTIVIGFGGVGAARAEQALHRKWALDDAGRSILLREPRPQQAGQWHVEAIDLVELHRRFWPTEDPSKVTVTMIAIGGYSGPVPAGVSDAIGYVSEVYLTR
jgi:hypothetical protein